MDVVGDTLFEDWLEAEPAELGLNLADIELKSDLFPEVEFDRETLGELSSESRKFVFAECVVLEPDE